MVTRFQSSPLLGYFIGLIAFTAPILGFVAPKGLAPLVICGGVIGILILKIKQRPINWLNRPVVVILAGLCVWALISSIWAIDGRSAGIGALKLMGNFIVGGLLFTVAQSLEEAERKIALRWLFAGFALVLAVVILEVTLGDPIYLALKGVSTGRNHVQPFWLNSVAVVLTLLIWPLVFAAVKKNVLPQIKKSTAILILGGFFGVLFFSIQIGYLSGLVAFGCGLFGAGVIWLFGRRAAIVAAAIFVVVGLTLPIGLTASGKPVDKIESTISLPSSANHRLKIWEFVADKIGQKRITGWGFNASKSIPGGKSYLYSNTGGRYGQALPLHPHNATLQFWLELGLPGVVLYLGLGVFLIMVAVDRHRSKIESALIFGQFSTIMIIANLSFGIWQAWWVATIWLSAALMAMVSEKRRTSG